MLEVMLLNRDGACVRRFFERGDANAAGAYSELPPPLQADVQARVRAAFETSLGWQGRLQRDRGSLDVTISAPQPDEAGRLLVALVLCDAADGEHGSLQKLARRNEAILRSAMDGFFVVNEDFRFLEVNGAFCRMLGYEPAELMQMRISDLEAPEFPDNGIPSHTRTGLHHFCTAHRHKDGRIVYLEVSITVLRDDGGKILVGFARDVTERRRQQEELERLSRRNRLILDSAIDGICGVDREGRTTFVNPAAARMLGAGPGELFGQALHTLLGGPQAGPRPCRTPQCALCAALREGQAAVQARALFTRLDGGQFPVEYSITPMYEKAAGVGAVIVFRDLSEREKAEAERRALERQIQQLQRLESLGLLAGGIAHDFNNMLVGILGNACLALEQLPDVGGARKGLQRIVSICERATQVVRQILAYSGQAGFEMRPLDVAAWLDETVGFMRAAVPRTIALAVEHAADLPPIEADHGQLHQVVTNLLVNAAEAIGDAPGSITVSADAVELSDHDLRHDYPGQRLSAGEFVRLRVSDTGCGMSPETLAQIFDPFFSVKGPGRGLGLAALHGIVRAHHGGVRVESEPGKGTCFTIVLPAARRAARLESEPAQAGGASTPARVLVIDDEEDVRDVARSILEQRGMQVLTAPDGRSGIETFRTHADQIDVVLLDMTMPGMRGGDVFREIRAIRPDAQVVVSSGYSEEDVMRRFLDSPPAGFVPKPYTLEALVQRISSVVRRVREASPQASPVVR